MARRALTTRHSPLTTHHSPLTTHPGSPWHDASIARPERRRAEEVDHGLDRRRRDRADPARHHRLRAALRIRRDPGALLGLAAGIGAAVWAIPRITDAVDPDWRTLAAVGSLLALLLIGSGIGGRIGHMVRRGADRLHLGIIDRLLGGALGLVIGAAVVYLAGSVLTGSGIPALSSAVDSSRALQIVVETTPAALDGVLERLR
ncbi:hypothetical protein CIK66_02455 [Brachybacterium alimentarium]|uniref:CvpA family protein n=1 Tax=Brachybacterium alimentarium TaxID=47845 RepID=A0A2A3YMZ0_9MICO|nr:hypothetical protein CIK66_02455 [Brachybacterium alimentarium]